MTRLGLGVRASALKPKGSTSLGPELCISPTAAGWSLSGTTPPTRDGTGLHFVNVSNLGAASYTIPTGIPNGATVEVTYTVANLVLGSLRALVYSQSNYVGAGTSRNANGTYTERFTLNGNPGSFSNQIRFQAQGSGTNNTYDVTVASVKIVY